MPPSGGRWGRSGPGGQPAGLPGAAGPDGPGRRAARLGGGEPPVPCLRLRRLVGDRPVARNDAYGLRVDPDERNATEFERLATEGRAALAAVTGRPPAAVVVSGPTGHGKTALAVRAAHTVPGRP